MATHSTSEQAPPADALRAPDALLQVVSSLHDRVVQPLAAASMALAGNDPLSPSDRACASMAVASALAELEAVLSATTLESTAGAETELEPCASKLALVVRAVVGEALANVRRHARPAEVALTVVGDGDGVTLDIVNDAILDASLHGGVGLGLAALQARSARAELDCGPVGDGTWRVRMRVPER